MKSFKNRRRDGALGRLNNSLRKGVKRTKDGDYVSLTDKDRARMEKEMDVLKSRIKY